MKYGDTIEPLIDNIYPVISTIEALNNQFFLERVILSSLNRDVNNLNKTTM
jgi:hypothetical protein